MSADIDFYSEVNPAVFKEVIKPVTSTGRGSLEDTVRAISAVKQVPVELCAYRLKAYATTRKLANYRLSPDLSD